MHIVLKTGFNVTHLAARWGIIACAVCLPLSGLHEWLLGEQLASLRPFLAASACLAVFWFGLRKEGKWAMFAGLCAALHLFGMAAIAPPKPVQEPAPCFRSLVINAYAGNQDQKRFAQIATQGNADVVIVSEVGSSLDNTLRQIYPHAHSIDVNHVFGLGIYSKFPIEESEVFRRGVKDLPVLRATLSTPSGKIHVVAVHPSPPVDSQALKDRNALIQEVAGWATESDTPSIIAGDFNATTWSHHMRPLHEVAERAPTGGTWPVGSWIKIPIDHIFYTGLQFKDSDEIVGEFGSDHVPIWADLCST